MAKFLSTFLFIACLLVLGCEGEQIPGEDWDHYMDVFAGPGPEEDFEDLFIKLNYDRFGNAVGEFEGPFYAAVEGTYADTEGRRQVSLEAVFRSNAYYGITRVNFDGTITNDVIIGTLFYQGVEAYEYYYLGQRVGGSAE